MKVGLVLAVSVVAACLGIAPEGEETVRIENRTGDVLRAAIQIVQREGEIPVFEERIVLAPGASEDYAAAMRPGQHDASIIASVGVSDRMSFAIPDAGDTTVKIFFTRAGATIETTST